MNRVILGRIIIGLGLVPALGTCCWLSDPWFKDSIAFSLEFIQLFFILLFMGIAVLIADIIYRILFGKYFILIELINGILNDVRTLLKVVNNV